MKRYYGYARVSTAKQGEKGVSLQEQRDAIARYAERNQMTILDWFEERETAAKRGRPVFGRMMKLLGQGKAEGVVIHKIDRSARNLKDWADLGELIDRGIEVHFANESLDLHSRGGRLSADIQAVVAADYIRNLREEAKKGIYGRLKQGVWPLPAPLGYLDQGAGKAKIPDPVRAPLVRACFDLYATGQYSLDRLVREMETRGLRSRLGNPLNRNAFSKMLGNPFYVGLMRVRKTGQIFEGGHAPLISVKTFERVQQALRGKLQVQGIRHAYPYRRLVTCADCGRSLIGERQKGRVYYRCQTRECPVTCVREDRIENAVHDFFRDMRFSEKEVRYFKTRLLLMREDWEGRRDEELAGHRMKLGQIKDRLGRLLDAYLDGTVDAALLEERKASLILDRRETEARIEALASDPTAGIDRVAEFLELAESLWLSGEMENAEERREKVLLATSNRRFDGKNVAIEPSIPFSALENRRSVSECGPQRDIPRTWNRVIDQLLAMADDLPRKPIPPENVPEVHPERDADVGRMRGRLDKRSTLVH